MKVVLLNTQKYSVITTVLHRRPLKNNWPKVMMCCWKLTGKVHNKSVDFFLNLNKFLSCHQVSLICVNVCLTGVPTQLDRKSTRLNSSHVKISYAVFCLKKKRQANL